MAQTPEIPFFSGREGYSGKDVDVIIVKVKRVRTMPFTAEVNSNVTRFSGGP